MDATDRTAGSARDNGTTRRRFVTRQAVEDAATAGAPLRLGPRDVLTHEAAARARDLGVAIDRGTVAGSATAPTSTASAVSAPTSTASAPTGGHASAARSGSDTGALRAAVRRAVIAELGTAPEQLDAVIDRAIEAQRSPRRP